MKARAIINRDKEIEEKVFNHIYRFGKKTNLQVSDNWPWVNSKGQFCPEEEVIAGFNRSVEEHKQLSRKNQKEVFGNKNN